MTTEICEKHRGNYLNKKESDRGNNIDEIRSEKENENKRPKCLACGSKLSKVKVGDKLTMACKQCYKGKEEELYNNVNNVYQYAS